MSKLNSQPVVQKEHAEIFQNLQKFAKASKF
jgi:hypothetical protein